MNRFLVLVRGELDRFNKYNVTTISVLVTLIWFLLLWFIDDEGILSRMLPFVLVIDATLMSVIFVGSVMFFEKTEQTLSTMLVTPLSPTEMVMGKAVANTVHTVLSSMAVVIVFHFVRDVEVSWVVAILVLTLGVFWHSLLGFVFSYHSKDFTGMLMNVMFYSFLSAIPALLNFFDVLFKGEVWEHVLLVTPTQSVIKLFEVAFGAEVTAKFWIALLWLLASGALGTWLYVIPKFKVHAVRQSGV
jgi:fluoroquinolone transport system permease protein